ncbi:MAG: hypothetical protein ACRELF_08335, partial [Gemmataceae bacterium]
MILSDDPVLVALPMKCCIWACERRADAKIPSILCVNISHILVLTRFSVVYRFWQRVYCFLRRRNEGSLACAPSLSILPSIREYSKEEPTMPSSPRHIGR